MFQNDKFIVSKLYSELEYVQALDELFFKKIDKLIMQPSMKSVIENVIEVIYTPLQNGTMLSQKIVNIDDVLEIV